MQFEAYARAIRALGREISPDLLVATRKLVQPLLDTAPASDVHVVRDVRYGSDARQRMDVFTAAGAPAPDKPVLVFVHGGGFGAGDKHAPGSPFYSNIAIWAVRNGCNAVNMTYRLAPAHQWPSGIEDVHGAIQCIRQQGERYGLDGSRIFLMGQSAGAAHAAAYVAHAELYAPHAHGLRGLILLSGLYNFARMRGPLEQAYLGADTELYERRSSLHGLVESRLPMLVTLAENDPPLFEQQGLELLGALQRKHQRLPRFVHMIGQNHLSVALYLGLPGDLLAPQLRAFIQEHG